MKNNIKPENRRLLEALYYLDEEVLSDVLADVRVPDHSPEMSKRRAFMRSLRYAAVIAACALLLGAIFPVVSNLIAYFGEGTGTQLPSGTTPPAEQPDLPDYLQYSSYVLTEDDLDSINAAWEAKYGVAFADSIEEAMEKTRNGRHYFGKYGDTIVIRFNSDVGSSMTYPIVKFNLGGNEFSFSGGQMCFFKDSEVYDVSEAASLLDQSQSDALYEYYTEEYLYYDSDGAIYSYPQFVTDLEYLSQKTMAEINESYYEWKYQELYQIYLVTSSVYGNLEEKADRWARQQLGDDSHRFFNPQKYDLYEYYGKFGDCVVLATETHHLNLTSISVAGYEFKLGGTGELIVWRGGEIMHIGEALEDGYLTEEDIARAHGRYLAYQEYLEGYSSALSMYVIPEYTPPEHTTEPVYWEFMPGTLSREEMLDIREAYAKFVFTHTYVSTYEDHIMNDWIKEDAEKSAFSNAKSYADKAFVKFFRNNNISERCYGKIGNTVVLALVGSRNGARRFDLADSFIEFSADTELLFYNGEDVFSYADFIGSPYFTKDDELTALAAHTVYEARIESIIRDAEAKATLPAPIGNTDLAPDFAKDFLDNPNTQPVNLYGTWGDCTVIGRTFGAPYNMGTFVGMYEFYYPENYMITVGCGGDAYDLSMAYHLGLIDDYELAEIYAMFNLYDRAVRQVNKEW